MTRPPRATVALLTFAAIVFGITPVAAAETVRIQLRWQHQFQFAGYYLALDRGYYREAGYDVELLDTTGEREPIREVVEGRAQYGVGSSDLVVARARGKPVLAVAAIFQHSPLVILALRSSNIDSVHDLASRRIAMEHEAADLIAYLKDEGIPGTAYQALPHAQSVRDLVSGHVDAMSAYQTDEPFELQALREDIRVFSPRAGGIDFYGDTLFTTEKELSAHPERVEAIRAATVRGWRDALKNPESAIDAILRRTSRHSREHLQFEALHTAPLIAADIVEVGYMNPARWQHIADTYVSLELVPRGFDASDMVYRVERKHIPLWLVGALIASLLGVLAIATGWVRAHRLARLIEAAGRRWKLFLETAPIPIVAVGHGGAVLYRNPQAQALDLQREDGIISGLLQRKELQQWVGTLEKGQTVAQIETFIEPDNQSAQPAQQRCLLLAASKASEGDETALVSIVDVTAHKELETSLRRNAELQAKLSDQRAEAQRRFVAMLSHEFRNPLAGIDRSADLLITLSPSNDAHTQRSLAGIRDQVRRLTALVDSILLTDPVDHEALEPRRRPFPVLPFLEQLRGTHVEEMRDRVTLEVVPEILKVDADERLLALALSNVLDNALRYSPMREAVVVRASCDETHVSIEVADRGPGVQDDVLRQLGTPYQRAHHGGPGTGLGYYFSTLIARSHGGDIVAENREGGGLTVAIRLPRA